jgi:hypothetical protein
MNKLDPGCIKKIDKKGGGFALMQNIERFNKAILNYGVPVRECFQTVDLWEKKNIPAVTLCIHALGRIVSDICFIYSLNSIIANWPGSNKYAPIQFLENSILKFVPYLSTFQCKM